MAVLLPLLPILGIGLTVAGQIQAGQAAAAQAESAQAMANYNAALAEREAKQAETKAEYESRRQAEAGARRMSELEAGLGAAGAVTTVGSPLLIQAKQASELELENLMIGYEGMETATAARSQAVLDRMQGKIYGQKAGYARTAGYLKAGTTLLTGFSQMY